MANAVYSHVLVNVSHAGTVSGSYVVPAGFAAIVRDVDYFYGGASVGAFGNVTDVASGAVFAWVSIPPSGGGAQWHGRQVFQPGTEFIGSLAASSGSATCTVRISGYLLTLP